eukprot:scaffold68493_cov24-Phaeocystis_antarctica.AAC.1
MCRCCVLGSRPCGLSSSGRRRGPTGWASAFAAASPGSARATPRRGPPRVVPRCTRPIVRSSSPGRGARQSANAAPGRGGRRRAAAAGAPTPRFRGTVCG